VTSTLVFEGEGRLEEYVGGYSDWLQQRKASPPATGAAPVPRTAAPGRDASASPLKPRRLSYKDQRELELLPAKIESLEREQVQLQQQIADPVWFRADNERSTLSLKRLQALQGELEAAYARWDQLES
jgi:ATP-binding cassette subfamily F protein uup